MPIKFRYEIVNQNRRLSCELITFRPRRTKGEGEVARSKEKALGILAGYRRQIVNKEANNSR